MKIDFEINKNGNNLKEVFALSEDEEKRIDEMITLCVKEGFERSFGETIEYIINTSKNHRELLLFFTAFIYTNRELESLLE